MAISQSLSSKKYATAYLNVFHDNLTIDTITNISHAAQFLKNHAVIMVVICAVGGNKKDQIEMLEKVFEYFKVTIPFERLVDVLLKRNDLCLLPTVLLDICHLYKERNNLLDMTIKSAQSLDEQEIEKFEAFFAKHAQKKLLVKTEVDESLLAGVRLQSEVFLWEYSIASRLRSLRQKFVIEG